MGQLMHCTKLDKNMDFLLFLLCHITVIMGWEGNNKYKVKNRTGQQVFFVAEENDFCYRQLCGPLRSFVLHVQDNTGQEVMTLTRPLRCGSCFIPCCLQEVIHILCHFYSVFKALDLNLRLHC